MVGNMADAEDSEVYNKLLRLIDTLPTKQQMVLRMKHIEGMEVEEIAAAVQMSIDAVYQNLSRARRSILEQFKKGAKL
jgi:RNA polymerase sigma-70 factor (ECF subfamily)